VRKEVKPNTCSGANPNRNKPVDGGGISAELTFDNKARTVDFREALGFGQGG
jgi:hypothetical protein